MALTPAQNTALKNDIATNFPSVPMNADGNRLLRDAYNQDASPAFTVWKTSVSVEDIMSNGFVWTEIDALTAGKARIWQWMAQLGTINPSRSNVRQGLGDAFSANAPNTLGNVSTGLGGLQPHLRRLARRAEKLFATGTGSVASPGTLTFEGELSDQDIETARQS